MNKPGRTVGLVGYFGHALAIGPGRSLIAANAFDRTANGWQLGCRKHPAITKASNRFDVVVVDCVAGLGKRDAKAAGYVTSGKKFWYLNPLMIGYGKYFQQ